MTALNTAIFVQGPTDPMEIYNVALQQILFYDGRDAAPGDISFHIHTDEDGREVIYAGPHENLPVLIGVYYRPGGMMFTEEEAREKFQNNCGNPGCMTHRPEAAHVIVALATDALWVDENRNWNAGNLHSGMVWGLGGFLDGKKVPWKWQENISLNVHEGYGELENLAPAVQQVKMGLSSPLGLGQMISRAILKKMGLLPDED